MISYFTAPCKREIPLTLYGRTEDKLMIPMLGFSAFSGTGKTTLIEQLISGLKRRGLKTAVIKHDVHGVDFDRAGKDSARFTAAGAGQVILAAPGNTFTIEAEEHTLKDLLSEIRGVDLILVEGYKYASIPKLGISRAQTGLGLPQPPESYLAVISDRPIPNCPVPRFDLNDIESILDFITEFQKQSVRSDESMTAGSCNAPSPDVWLREARSEPDAARCGMYLFHNGVVRQSPKSQVRFGKEDAEPVTGMFFTYDEGKVHEAIRKTRAMPGIFHVRVWLNSGELSVGDDLMLVLIGGDIRPHVVDALQALVDTLKSTCVTEVERTE